MPVSRTMLFSEIDYEREHQDRKWGGPTHDDTHPSEDWRRWIEERLAVIVGPIHPKQKRRLWIEIAALSVAALESLNRREADLLDDEEE